MRRSESITIAVLGAPAVVTQLRAFLPGHTIQNRPVVVRALSNINDVRDAHVLFIGAENNGRLRQLVDRVGQRPVLVVTDAADGLEHGAMVNFQVVEERLRFEISLPAAESVGLMLSSRLLSTAMRVETVNCRFNCQDLPSVRRVVASTVFPQTFSARADGRVVGRVTRREQCENTRPRGHPRIPRRQAPARSIRSNS